MRVCGYVKVNQPIPTVLFWYRLCYARLILSLKSCFSPLFCAIYMLMIMLTMNFLFRCHSEGDLSSY